MDQSRWDNIVVFGWFCRTQIYKHSYLEITDILYNLWQGQLSQYRDLFCLFKRYWYRECKITPLLIIYLLINYIMVHHYSRSLYPPNPIILLLTVQDSHTPDDSCHTGPFERDSSIVT